MADFWGGFGKGFTPAFEKAWESAEEKEEAERKIKRAAALARQENIAKIRGWGKGLPDEVMKDRILPESSYLSQDPPFHKYEREEISEKPVEVPTDPMKVIPKPESYLLHEPKTQDVSILETVPPERPRKEALERFLKTASDTEIEAAAIAAQVASGEGVTKRGEEREEGRKAVDRSYTSTKALLEQVAGSGVVEVPVKVLSRFSEEDRGSLNRSFGAFAQKFSNSSVEERDKSYMDNLKKLAPVSNYETWITMPMPPEGSRITEAVAMETWESYKGGERTPHRAERHWEGEDARAVADKYMPMLKERFASLRGVGLDDAEIAPKVDGAISRLTTNDEAADYVEKLDEAVANQAYLSWFSRDDTPQVTPEEKAMIKSFWKSPSWSDPEALSTIMDKIKFSRPVVDASDRNIKKIKELRDSLAGTEKGSDEYNKAKENYELALAFTSSGYYVDTEQRDGKMFFRAVKSGSGKKPYTLTASPSLRGFVVTAALNPDIIRKKPGQSDEAHKREVDEAQALAKEAARLMHETAQSMIFFGTDKRAEEGRKDEVKKKTRAEHLRSLEAGVRTKTLKAIAKSANGLPLTPAEVKLLEALPDK